MSNLELTLGPQTTLSVRRLSVEESVSSPFSLRVIALSETPTLDIESLTGGPAKVCAVSGYKFAHQGSRRWSGVARRIEQIQAEPRGLSEYSVHVVPALWLLGQRRGHRIFQHLSVPEIVGALLSEWRCRHRFEIDPSAHPKLEYKVQYGESDLAFVSRLLEEAGIAYVFREDEEGSLLVLGDALQTADPRPPLPYVNEPDRAAEREYVRRVRLTEAVRPGAIRIRDFDFRSPDLPLTGVATAGEDHRLEHYHYHPGASLIEPHIDFALHDPKWGHERAARALAAARGDRLTLGLETNAVDLAPGVVFSITSHPHSRLGGRRLLCTGFSLEAEPSGEWIARASAVPADIPHRPAAVTPRPRVHGLECATVVGPAGEEIFTDSFGRVRVQFPWDREGRRDEHSSCWLRVSQGWAGTGYGVFTMPRVGQEVLVGFVGGDPEQPLVVGRVHGGAAPTPHELPAMATSSSLKGATSPGGGGHNEVTLGDAAAGESFAIHAEHDLSELVKDSETITIAALRTKSIGASEEETTGGSRSEITGGARTERTSGDRKIAIGGGRKELLSGDRLEQIVGTRQAVIEGDLHLVTAGAKKALSEVDDHTVGKGDRREKIVGARSVSVAEDRRVKVGGSYGLAVGRDSDVLARETLVVEGADVTLAGPGGFLRIDAGGVTISGTIVRINAGGEPNHLVESTPEDALEAVERAPPPKSAPPPKD